MRRLSPPVALLAAVLVAALLALAQHSVAASGAAPTAAEPWRPHISDAATWAARRRGQVSFSVRTPTRAWGLRATRTFPSASVLKPMLMVAFLRTSAVRSRALRRAERSMLTRLITRSDNPAANRLIAIVGADGLKRLARRAGMRSFVPVTGLWGLSSITAADQTRFFLGLHALLPARHRAYAMALLAAIVPSQRWGIGRVDVRGWRLYFKGGWGSGTGAVNHQVALLRRGEQRLSLAILTRNSASHAYGKETLRGVAARLLRGLPQATIGATLDAENLRVP